MIVITKAEDKKKDTFGLFNSKNRRGIYGIGLGATLNVRDIECFPPIALIARAAEVNFVFHQNTSSIYEHNVTLTLGHWVMINSKQMG